MDEREQFEEWYCADAERQGMPMRDGIAPPTSVEPPCVKEK